MRNKQGGERKKMQKTEIITGFVILLTLTMVISPIYGQVSPKEIMLTEQLNTSRHIIAEKNEEIQRWVKKVVELEEQVEELKLNRTKTNESDVRAMTFEELENYYYGHLSPAEREQVIKNEYLLRLQEQAIAQAERIYGPLP